MIDEYNFKTWLYLILIHVKNIKVV
jgi:hypothetical protein